MPLLETLKQEQGVYMIKWDKKNINIRKNSTLLKKKRNLDMKNMREYWPENIKENKRNLNILCLITQIK